LAIRRNTLQAVDFPSNQPHVDHTLHKHKLRSSRSTQIHAYKTSAILSPPLSKKIKEELWYQAVFLFQTLIYLFYRYFTAAPHNCHQKK